jgi:hypothetical protein
MSDNTRNMFTVRGGLKPSFRVLREYNDNTGREFY